MNPKLKTIQPDPKKKSTKIPKPKPKEKRENFANSGPLSSGFSRLTVAVGQW